MATIKESNLKELFKEYGLSEGIFDLFKKKSKSKISNSTKKKLAAIDKDLDDVIASGVNDEEKQALRDLADLLATMN
tara:strand:- start:1842 stop:2072 length:231 start_codon:yes stop_codon:yes gene_type:complete